ncbi:MAG: hypothetical protein KOO65_03170 [Desulfobacterales bacterium]|nr:hypothetical protein [Desulfobacterales bacterium]MBU8910250.1 hypothetical protein [Desulfobacterales bacterium]
MSIKVYDIAHCRAGDKGRTVNISVIAFDETGFHHLQQHLTPKKVAEDFFPIAEGPVSRYELPKLKAFNFVIENVRGGGVTVSLFQDIHGKTLSYLMLAIVLPDN